VVVRGEISCHQCPVGNMWLLRLYIIYCNAREKDGRNTVPICNISFTSAQAQACIMPMYTVSYSCKDSVNASPCVL
jgi:hypothetical protein